MEWSLKNANVCIESHLLRDFIFECNTLCMYAKYQCSRYLFCGSCHTDAMHTLIEAELAVLVVLCK
jgi:hypothetical protein